MADLYSSSLSSTSSNKKKKKRKEKKEKKHGMKKIENIHKTNQYLKANKREHKIFFS